MINILSDSIGNTLATSEAIASLTDAYNGNVALEHDWKAISEHKPRRIHFGHAKEQYFNYSDKF